MLTVRQMQYFDALSRTLHFGQAAKLMHVSQPAISVQIALMEEDIGAKLVERSRGTVVLTAKGKSLLPRVRKILHEIEDAHQSLSIERGVLTGVLKLGVIPTVAPYVLPQIIPRLRKSYPSLQLNVRETMTEHLVEALQNGDLDVIMAAEPIKLKTLRRMRLFEDRFFMAVSTNDRDVLASPLVADQVQTERLLLLEDGHCLRDQALDVCATRSDKQVIDFGATSLSTLLQMVAHDMGQTLLPEIAIEAETARNNEVNIVPFAGAPPSRTISLFWRNTSNRHEDLRTLGRIIEDVMAKVLSDDTNRQ